MRHRDGPGALVRLLSRCASVVLALLWPLLSCREAPRSPAGAPEKLTIANISLAHSALVHVAFARGYFPAEGLEVAEQPHQLGRQALASVLEGKADLATAADTPVMFAIEGGNDVDVLATIATSRDANGIVARRDRGILRAADLKGKRIGVPLGSTAHYYLGSFLSLSGIGEGEVRLLDLKPAELSAALRGGQVDAVSIWQPWVRSIAAELGANGLVLADDALYSDRICLVGRGSFVRDHAETIRKVLRALLRAEVLLRENPEDAGRVVAAAIHVDPVTLGVLWPLFEFRLTLDQGLLVSLEDQSQWARRNHLVGEGPPPDFLRHLSPAALVAVKPDAVKLIR